MKTLKFPSANTFLPWGSTDNDFFGKKLSNRKLYESLGKRFLELSNTSIRRLFLGSHSSQLLMLHVTTGYQEVLCSDMTNSQPLDVVGPFYLAEILTI